MKFRLEPATADDAAALAALHTEVADDQTYAYGRGPWSTHVTETSVHYALRNSHVFVARMKNEIVGTLRLTTKKPWAIDTDYFSPARKPLYLTAMAVTPTKQRQGIGRACLEDVKRIAKEWSSDAIRLDAHDATAGAGNFYRRCGWMEKGRATYRGAALIYYEFQCATK